MSTTYNPTPALDTSFTYPSDGDAANVASLIMLLDLADATKFFADLLDGTSAGVTLKDPTVTGTAQIEVANFTTGWSVATDKIVAAATAMILNTGIHLQVGGNLFVIGTSDFADDVVMHGDLNIDDDLIVDGVARLDEIDIDSGAVQADSTLFNFTTTPIRVAGMLNMTGTGRLKFNSAAGVDSNHTYNLGDPQIIFVPTLTGTRDYTIAEAGMDEGDFFLITMTADTTSAGVNGIIVKRGVDASQIGPSIVKGGAVEWMLVMYRNGRLQPALWGANDT